MGSEARLWAGLEPEGRWDEPCLVVCQACSWSVRLASCAEAQVTAAMHDRAVHGVTIEPREPGARRYKPD